MDLIVEVPEAFAVALFADGLAVRPLRARSGGEAVQTIIDVVGVVANMTSIVVAVAAFPEISRRLVEWVRGDVEDDGSGAPNEVQVSTSTGLVVRVSVPHGERGAAIDVTVVAEVTSGLERAASEKAE